MPRTKNVEELIAKFSAWEDFFWLDMSWNADKEEQKSYFQTFYNFVALRTNIHTFSLNETNDFLDYLQSTRLQDYRFLTNLENPFKPELPSDKWFDDKTNDISKTFKTKSELKIIKGTANAQNTSFGQPLIVIRPYDFSVFERKTG
ncbi:MAG: hypothetical protein V1886_02275 [archaeon]